jgi:hypothetical protein
MGSESVAPRLRKPKLELGTICRGVFPGQVSSQPLVGFVRVIVWVQWSDSGVVDSVKETPRKAPPPYSQLSQDVNLTRLASLANEER